MKNKINKLIFKGQNFQGHKNVLNFEKQLSKLRNLFFFQKLSSLQARCRLKPAVGSRKASVQARRRFKPGIGLNQELVQARRRFRAGVGYVYLNNGLLSLFWFHSDL